MNGVLLCGDNCYYAPFSTEMDDGQILLKGFYYIWNKQYIGPFKSISETEESERLGYVNEEMFEMA